LEPLPVPGTAVEELPEMTVPRLAAEVAGCWTVAVVVVVLVDVVVWTRNKWSNLLLIVAFI